MRLRDVTFAVLLGVITPVAGIGLLYLLRNSGLAHVGLKAAGALPLEQLDRTDAQPLARIALAWLPVGLAAGLVIATFTRMSRALALTVLALIAATILVVSGGVSDSVTNNEALTQHLATPLGVAGTWVSLGFLVIGVAVGQVLAAMAARAPSAA